MTPTRLFCLLTLSLLMLGSISAAAERPNIILCMADDQGWGDVGYNGNPVQQTPVLDDMAASGLRFDRFYAAAPVCSPTRGSVLTGRHPNRFGCFSWGFTLRPQEITLAEVLQKAGYKTGHFGKWHLGSARADSPVSPGKNGFDEWFSSPNFYENNPLMSHNGKVVKTKGEGSAVTVDAALNFIRQAKQSNEPFFAVVWFGSPHNPHQAIPEDLKKYKDQPKPLAHYMGEITAMDRAMGTLRTELKSMGIADNTLVWYTSDNGPQGGRRALGSAGHFSGRKGTLMEGGIRVPTIIEWPAKIKKPRITDQPGNTVDIYPTIVDLLDLEVKEQPPLDGVSLVSLIEDDGFNREKPMGFWVYDRRGHPVRSHELLEEMLKEQEEGRSNPEAATLPAYAKVTGDYDPEHRPGHAVWMDGPYKLHRIPGKKKDSFTYQLYNLVEDPKEKKDLSQAQPERVEAMKEALKNWQRSVIASMNGKDY